MSTPYWTDGSVSLYLGDCRLVTEWLSADVLVTDPPYGRAWRQGDTCTARGWVTDQHKGIAGDGDTTLRETALAMWDSARVCAVFGDLMLAPPPGTRQVLGYRKPRDSGGRGATGGFRRDLEAIYLLGPWPSGLGGNTSVLVSGERMRGGPGGTAGRYGHPHAKPVDVMETLIASCPAGTIADPFAGSGSTLAAARNQGRCAIGVEIEERYCEAIARRLDQPVMDFGEVSA